MSISNLVDLIICNSTEAYIRHHLLHKTAGKICFSHENARNKWLDWDNINNVKT